MGVLTILVEHWSLPTFFFYVLPYVIRRRIRAPRQITHIYFIDGDRWSERCFRAILRLMGVGLERLNFRLIDVRDEQGALIRLRLSFQDLGEIQEKVILQPAFQRVLKHPNIQGDQLKAYLEKQATAFTPTNPNITWRFLFLVQLLVWKTKGSDIKAERVLFATERMWSVLLREYAAQHGVSTVFSKFNRLIPKEALLRVLGEDRLRTVVRWIRQDGIFVALQRIIAGGDSARSPNAAVPSEPKIFVEYYGHFNLDRPELNSDLFFWQQSHLNVRNLLVSFNLSNDPLDEERLNQLQDKEIDAVVLNPKAVRGANIPVHSYWGKYSEPEWLNGMAMDRTTRCWFSNELKSYQYARDYWIDLLKRHNVKVYMAWFKYDAQHMVIADALASIGGITAIYQRAVDQFPSPETTVGSDILFGFSTQDIALELASRSNISYYVITGYNGDHRFPLVRDMAQRIRRQLQSAGAKKIVAFFDENSRGDSRWHTGHEFMRENYRFLLDKVLTVPDIGLVIKPKAAFDLRQRLGPVAELLKEAEKTGRCFIFEQGNWLNAYPPSAAAQAADVAVHGHLCAATAGIEAYLAGVPTLLMDREGWPHSPLYKLGKGRVVFTEWDHLWRVCLEHWKTPGGVPGFGDWSSIQDELDPFRDGRAAERIGTYLEWLVEGFRKGWDRREVLENAASRYAQQWGSDKIVRIKDRIVTPIMAGYAENFFLAG